MLKPSNTHYTETEAARRLGITIEQLRQLVHRQLVGYEQGAPLATVTTFSSSDLVMLRVLAQQASHPDSL